MDLSKGKVISLKEKALFDSYFERHPPEISEFTFTNLFIWRHHYDFEFIEFKNHLIIYSKTFLQKRRGRTIGSDITNLYFLPPVGPSPELIMQDLANEFKDIEFHKVPKKLTNKINENNSFDNNKLKILNDRDNWDYIYEISNLIELSGNKYRQNRRWLKKFLNKYDYEFKILTEEMIDKCKELQIEWCMIRGCEDGDILNEEQIAINEALDHFKELNYIGSILCIDDKCVGYSFGEKLNKDTVVIHIEKAHTHFEGSYQAINQLFLKNCFSNFKYVNREQDLGIDGLRKAKESYKPPHMVEKSIIIKEG